jgi:hypothetical protein
MEKCRDCGCTDQDCRQCIIKTGAPCYWVESDLCSACAEADDRFDDLEAMRVDGMIDEIDFTPCARCDGHPACEDFGCALLHGLKTDSDHDY